MGITRSNALTGPHFGELTASTSFRHHSGHAHHFRPRDCFVTKSGRPLDDVTSVKASYAQTTPLTRGHTGSKRRPAGGSRGRLDSRLCFGYTASLRCPLTYELVGNCPLFG